MGKKGFTLVELLAVIVVLSLVMAMSFVSINAVRQSSLERIVETKIGQIEQAAVLYAQDNPEILTEPCDVDGVHYDYYCKVLTVRDIIEAGSYFESGDLVTDESGTYVDLINDVTGKSMLDDTVQVYRKNNRIYSVMLEVKSNETS